MSVDIRRSTDLMLKARRPQAFAQFITTLCVSLANIVWEHHGIFDKFTGDGILAFFPKFHTGADAGYWAVKAADASHKTFAKVYKKHHHCFTCVPQGAGLGIGIDYGTTHLVTVSGNLTVVGTPVVYACRLGGAPARMTLLNQRAYEQIRRKHGPYCRFERTELEVKGEGKLLAYSVSLHEPAYKPKIPGWLSSLTTASAQNPVETPSGPLSTETGRP
jgi:class 3 adenylate cyclase